MAATWEYTDIFAKREDVQRFIEKEFRRSFKIPAGEIIGRRTTITRKPFASKKALVLEQEVFVFGPNEYGFKTYSSKDTSVVVYEINELSDSVIQLHLRSTLEDVGFWRTLNALLFALPLFNSKQKKRTKAQLGAMKKMIEGGVNEK